MSRAASRETRASAGFALAWLLVLAVLGTQATSEDGKIGVCLLLVMLAFGGAISGIMGWIDQSRHGRLVTLVNIAFGLISILFGIAAFS